MSSRDSLSVTDVVRYGGRRPDAVAREDRRYWHKARLRDQSALRAEADARNARLPLLKMTFAEQDALLRLSKRHASSLWCDLSMSAARRAAGYELRIKRDVLASLLKMLAGDDVAGLEGIRDQAAQIAASLPEETKAFSVPAESMDEIVAHLEGEAAVAVEDAALAARFLRKGRRVDGRVSVDMTPRQARRLSKVLTACSIAPLCVQALNAF